MVVWIPAIALASMITGGVLTWLYARSLALGDVNRDGEVNILDVKKVKLAYSGLIEEPRADLDDNGVVNILDVKKVKLIYSGIL